MVNQDIALEEREREREIFGYLHRVIFCHCLYVGAGSGQDIVTGD